MFTIAKRPGLAFFVGLVAFGGMLPGVQAQRRSPQGTPAVFNGPRNAGQPLLGIQPFFQVAPGLSLPQAAYNTTVMGSAYQNFPARAMPFAPGYAMGFSPLSPAGQMATGAGLGNSSFFYNSNPYAFSNPFAASMSSAAGLPYASYGSGGGGYPPYPPYPPYDPSYYDPYRGYLSGSADVIRGQANYLVSSAQAQLTKQSVYREKIDNRRRAFEEWLYEREKMPTAEDERQRVRELELRRARNDPPPTEIYSGKALNDLVNHLLKLPNTNLTGAQFPVDDDVMAHVNLRPDGIGRPNAGLLRNSNKISWPLALEGEDFRSEKDLLDSLIPDAVAQAKNGRVGAGTLTDLNNAMDRLQKKLRNKIKDIPPNQHMDARRFLSNLEDAVKALNQADAGKYVDGTYAARAKNVPELIDEIKRKGLRLAPAVPGDEAAYKAVHEALVAYDIAAQNQVAEKR